MTLFHIENKTGDGGNQEYREYHRVGGETLAVEIEFYPDGIMYTEATVSVLSREKTWTELCEFTPDLWHAGAKDAKQGDERMAVFKQVAGFLYNVALEGLGLVTATPAENPVEA